MGALQVNYNLLAVNFFMAITGLYQLSRKASQDFGGKVCYAQLRNMNSSAAEPLQRAIPLLRAIIGCTSHNMMTSCCPLRLL